jgi:hypothetical protein
VAQAPNPDAGRLHVAEQLRLFGARRGLVRAAELGYVTELACAIPECLCPEELGGTRFFERKMRPLPDWMPTPDQFPKLKMEGVASLLRTSVWRTVSATGSTSPSRLDARMRRILHASKQRGGARSRPWAEEATRHDGGRPGR